MGKLTELVLNDRETVVVFNFKFHLVVNYNGAGRLAYFFIKEDDLLLSSILNLNNSLDLSFYSIEAVEKHIRTQLNKFNKKIAKPFIETYL